MSAYIKICLANLQGAPSSSVNPSESEAYMQKEKNQRTGSAVYKSLVLRTKDKNHFEVTGLDGKAISINISHK